MKFSTVMRCGAALAVALLMTSTVWGHGSSTIQIGVVVDGGNLKITTGTDVGGLKVFADNADVFNVSGQTNVPGWSFDAALNTSTIQLKVLDTLLYWTPANGLSATTTDNLVLRRLFFPSTPDSATVGQTSITDPTTIAWDSATVGQSHHIMRYDVPAGSPAAAYGVLLQLEDLSSSSPKGPSEPFLLVLNKGLTNTPNTSVAGQALDESQFGLAITAMTNELNAEAESVPEPATVALMGLAGLAAIPFLRRLRQQRKAA